MESYQRDSEMLLWDSKLYNIQVSGKYLFCFFIKKTNKLKLLHF